MARAAALGLAALLAPHGVLAARMVQTSTSGAPECSKAVATPLTGQSLKDYFDSLRTQSSLLNPDGTSVGKNGLVDTSKCSKKDVCLLMRQLDMDFFKRAREGLLSDADYDIPPTKAWIADGTCKNQEKVRGFKMKPVTDAETCRKLAAAEKKAEFSDKVFAKSPAGCVVRRYSDGKGKTKAVAYINEKDTGAKAGIAYEGSKKYETEVLCEMDRSLEESAAAYYSPYKLKPSMVSAPGKSTACSFGMYAFLSKLQETNSACAAILTYKPTSKFSSAKAALYFAEDLERKNMTAQAASLRTYVETMRQKYVLIDTIANQWCPSVWNAAQAKPGATCEAARVMSWTAEGKKLSTSTSTITGKPGPVKGSIGGRLGNVINQLGGKAPVPANQAVLDAVKNILTEEDTRAENIKGAKEGESVGQTDSRGKPAKIALTEDACSSFPDQTLAELLQMVPEAPPDFFQNADVKVE